MFDLETGIRRWRGRLTARGRLAESDVAELECHLRDQIDSLVERGLEEDEAFLVGVKRLGNAEALTREFSRANTDRLWRQLMVEPSTPEERSSRRREITLVVILALAAGALAKVPALFGISPYDTSPGALAFLRNTALFALPPLCLYLVIRNCAGLWRSTLLFLWFAVAAIVVNLYPFAEPHHTELLVSLHAPIALWLVVGIAYTGGNWGNSRGRMDFVRFSGEAFIYAVLLGCGGAVLVWLFAQAFASIGVDITRLLMDWVAILGAFAIPMVAVYLVEEKKSVVENMAPVLARVFTPLFLAAMTMFLVAMVVRGASPFTGREFLIAIDLLLALVLGLVLYTLSARDPEAGVGGFDYLTLALICTALVIDGIALSAILFRIASFGFTPNKTAALGENVVLLANLAGLAVLYTRFVVGRGNFGILTKWQTSYLPVYSAWAAVVVIVFPIVFRFG